MSGHHYHPQSSTTSVPPPPHAHSYGQPVYAAPPSNYPGAGGFPRTQHSNPYSNAAQSGYGQHVQAVPSYPPAPPQYAGAYGAGPSPWGYPPPTAQPPISQPQYSHLPSAPPPPPPPPRSQGAYSASTPSVPAFGGTFLPPLPPSNNFSYPAGTQPQGNGRSFGGNNHHHQGGGRGRPFDRNQRGRHDGPGHQNRHNNQHSNHNDVNQNGKRGRERGGGHPKDQRSTKRPHFESNANNGSTSAAYNKAQPSLALPPKPPKPSGFANETKKKHKNMLGLTPKAEDAPPSDDEADEEATLAQQLNADTSDLSAPNAINLRSQEDIAKWIAERKRKYPTKANIAAKMTLLNMAEVAGGDVAKQTAPGAMLANYDSSSDEGSEPEEQSSKKEVPALAKQPTAHAPSSTPETLPTPAPTPRLPSALPSNPGKVYCKTWANLGFCTWKKCKFLHALPGAEEDRKKNEEHAAKQLGKHRRNLYQEFVKHEELEKQDKALRFIKLLGSRGLLAVYEG